MELSGHLISVRAHGQTATLLDLSLPVSRKTAVDSTNEHHASPDLSTTTGALTMFRQLRWVVRPWNPSTTRCKDRCRGGPSSSALWARSGGLFPHRHALALGSCFQAAQSAAARAATSFVLKALRKTGPCHCLLRRRKLGSDSPPAASDEREY